MTNKSQFYQSLSDFSAYFSSFYHHIACYVLQKRKKSTRKFILNIGKAIFRSPLNKKVQQFSVHLITHPDVFDGEIETIKLLMQNADFYLHLRKPNMDETSYENYVKLLPEKLYNRIILHSAYYLAEQYSFAGLHFSTSKINLANNILFTCCKHASCHSFEDVSNCETDFKQCFLSPVFDSISKQGYSAAFDTDKLTSFLTKDRKIKIIALGGINVNNINQVQKMGFDGAAILGAVWGNNPQKDDDFKSRLDEILNCIY